MRTEIRKRAVTLICAAIAAAGSVRAASAQPTDPMGAASKVPTLLVTPFIAMGDDLAPGAGAAFTFPWTRSLSVEAEASLGSDAVRSSLSLLYGMPRLGGVVPYVVGGLGVQRDEVSTGLPGIGFPTDTKVELALNIGAGISVPVRDRWSYRADFRWYNPDNSWPESWRVYSGIAFGFRR